MAAKVPIIVAMTVAITALSKVLVMAELTAESCHSASYPLREKPVQCPRDSGNKYHGYTADDTGFGERQNYIQKNLAPISTQVQGGVDKTLLILLKDGVDGQDHEGKKVIDHA